MPTLSGTTIARAAVALLVCGTAFAQRQPVLPQIDVPHDYYFREMYLPRVTTGQTDPAWLPDGETLVYSMQGSLWRQRVGSGIAEQVTEGALYDFQPDVSPDGERIVFARYDGEAIELWLHDLVNGESRALTSGGNVNVEPRWAPDGRRVAFVSTAGSGRFHVRIGALTEDGIESRRLRPERESRVPRYYYSRYDHELSPAWSPDGESLLFVANPEVPWGTGGIWRQPLDGGEAELLRAEETTWKAGPELLPDGRRYLYASYLGRQWHQIWFGLAGAKGEPFPLTYGDFDATDPRASPDGERFAYVVNEHGNTAIRVQELVGGATIDLAVSERRYLSSRGRLELRIAGADGDAVPARIAVLGADGRAYAPDGAWMHADDSRDRRHARTETHYFHLSDPVLLQLPAGTATITVWRGPEYRISELDAAVHEEGSGPAATTIVPTRLDLPDDWVKQVSGDVHVHMNYGGTYRSTPERLVAQAEAEDLDVVFNLVVNKEQRIPDVGAFLTEPDPATTPEVLLLHGQEFHTSVWGHLALLGLDSHLLLPDYAGYPETAAASLYPDNATIAELARAQGALVGYVHPFLSPPPDPATDESLTNALPVDAALGLLDFYEVVGFADHRTSAEVWYRLMNCGIRLPAAGGTDAMTNYASLRGPVGLNRTYVRIEEPATDPAARERAWLEGLAAGRSFATNTPLIGFELQGQRPGGELAIDGATGALSYSGFLRSNVPIDHLEVVANGAVVARHETGSDGRSADIEGSLELAESGWVLLRAWNDGSHPLVFDLYPYATTTPVWITHANGPARSREDADYFLAWIDRLRGMARQHPDYNSALERQRILERLDAASERFAACR